jgi:ribosome modulation factor
MGSPGGGEFVNDCGGGVWGNSNTSCPFAQNVHQKWWDPSVNPKGAAGGASELTIDVYSPVTNQTYTMNCWRDASGVTCRGGNDAAVWFQV